MVIEDYQLSVLRDDLLTEFGKDIADASLQAIAVRKLNDAQTQIANKRQDWPWRLGEHVIATQASVAVTADVTKASKTVANVTPNAAGDLRRILVDGSSGTPGTSGYLISNVVAGTYTLQSQYLGETAVTKAMTIMEGVFALPADCDAIQIIEGVGALSNIDFKYRSPLLFERIKRKGDLLPTGSYIYTIKPDPINLTTSVIYLMVYPFIAELMNLHINYWRTIPKLVNAADVPIIPVEDRITLLHWAYWLAANSFKIDDQRTLFYKGQALESLASMEKSYELGQEPEFSPSSDLIPGGFVTPPAGYPRFKHLN